MWQDISTAPKDGSDFIGVDGGGRICIYRYEKQEFHKRPKPYFLSRSGGYDSVTWDRDHQPTHWMPLPNPPAKDENND